MPQITCADCGDAYQAKRKDAKHCPPCRLLRVLTFASKRFKGYWRCKACGAKFRPAGRPSRLCGRCIPARPAPEVNCAICHERRPMYERVAVCQVCVMDPEQQPKVVRALQAGQAKRKAPDSQLERARTDLEHTKATIARTEQGSLPPEIKARNLKRLHAELAALTANRDAAPQPA